MQDVVLGIETKDFIFAGIVATSFFFSYLFSKYNYLPTIQEKSLEVISKDTSKYSSGKKHYDRLSSKENFDISKSYIKESIRLNMEKLNKKHKNDFPQYELNNLDLNSLTIVKNDLDFNKNWLNMKMDDVIYKIENLHPGEISETSSNSWQLYIFIKLLNFYPNITKFFNTLDLEHRLIIELLETFKINNGFSHTIINEKQRYETFTKFVLNKQTNGSIKLLFNVLKNYHKTSLNL